jgi:hypothetical protein
MIDGKWLRGVVGGQVKLFAPILHEEKVIRRNMNRRHMINDHHGRTAGRETLLVRAMDEILGRRRT